jgi:hypothetical protein
LLPNMLSAKLKNEAVRGVSDVGKTKAQLRLTCTFLWRGSRERAFGIWWGLPDWAGIIASQQKELTVIGEASSWYVCSSVDLSPLRPKLL